MSRIFLDENGLSISKHGNMAYIPSSENKNKFVQKKKTKESKTDEIERLFADQNSSIYKLRRQVRSGELGILNRLRSIDEDAELFANYISLLPASAQVFANKRCGVWYAPPSTKHCYFKSTDGHCHNWQFSWSRTNTHLIHAIASSSITSKDVGIAVLVDSTRKGKRFPDSFSRTIPIWCCVVNRAIAWYAENHLASTFLHKENASESFFSFQRRMWSLARELGQKEKEEDSAQEVCFNETTDEFKDSKKHDNIVEPNKLSHNFGSTFSYWSSDLHTPDWISPMERSQIESILPRFVDLFVQYVGLEELGNITRKYIQISSDSAIGWEIICPFISPKPLHRSDFKSFWDFLISSDVRSDDNDFDDSEMNTEMFGKDMLVQECDPCRELDIIKCTSRDKSTFISPVSAIESSFSISVPTSPIILYSASRVEAQFSSSGQNIHAYSPHLSYQKREKREKKEKGDNSENRSNYPFLSFTALRRRALERVESKLETNQKERAEKLTSFSKKWALHGFGRESWTYVQGAGDDEETWALGLSPEVFHANARVLLQSSDNDDCSEKITSLLSGEQRLVQEQKGYNVVEGIKDGNEQCSKHFQDQGEATNSLFAPVLSFFSSTGVLVYVARKHALDSLSLTKTNSTFDSAMFRQVGKTVGKTVRSAYTARDPVLEREKDAKEIRLEAKVLLLGENCNGINYFNYRNYGNTKKLSQSTWTHSSVALDPLVKAVMSCNDNIDFGNVDKTKIDMTKELERAIPPANLPIRDCIREFLHEISACESVKDPKNEGFCEVSFLSLPISSSKKAKNSLLKYLNHILAFTVSLFSSKKRPSEEERDSMSGTSSSLSLFTPNLFIVCDSIETYAAVLTALYVVYQFYPLMMKSSLKTTMSQQHPTASDLIIEHIRAKTGLSFLLSLPRIDSLNSEKDEYTSDIPSSMMHITSSYLSQKQVQVLHDNTLDHHPNWTRWSCQASKAVDMQISVISNQPDSDYDGLLKEEMREITQKVLQEVHEIIPGIFPPRNLSQQLNRYFCSASTTQ